MSCFRGRIHLLTGRAPLPPRGPNGRGAPRPPQPSEGAGLAAAELSWVATFEATICRQWLRRLFDGVPNAPRVVHESMEFPNHIEMVRAGLAVALIPRLGRAPLTPDVVAIPTWGPSSTRDVLVVHRRAQQDSPALRAVIESLTLHSNHLETVGASEGIQID